MSEACFTAADILLPAASVPLDPWACIAVDQFTSQPEYWQRAEARAEGDDQRLEHLNSRIEKLHSKTRGLAAHEAQTAGPAPASFQYVIESSRFLLGFIKVY